MDAKDRVAKELNQMDAEKKEDILENFNRFKMYLSDKVSKGESLGLNEEQLAKTTEFVANYLSKHEEPRNREQYLLQELWNAGDKEEQHALAHMLLKLVRQA
ncbi:hypothetical protein NCCP2222_22390 [Sporosarcina sp. NCCP-2222]|uniref:DUF3243 domain-containing protein n=1 Tax=Sporosarcina sp. NCCP-2222 TaxID=2935073 RepID=UPI00207F60DE|nr:DUF3243 domain-containing protein [Sporosarcina sp. NCCP-2222]GKV56292.1 hypothetical protein NCCP2222_22390 [Sporosarcina sp. NCCP-2222]